MARTIRARLVTGKTTTNYGSPARRQPTSARRAVIPAQRTSPEASRLTGHLDMPRSWYEHAAAVMGAQAEAEQNGSATAVILKVGRHVVFRVLEPRGLEMARKRADTFNKESWRYRLNPPGALVDAWR